MTLRSPIDGAVLGLTVTTVGQVLTVGEEVMRIVPEDAALEVEGYLPNKDIGFVHPGATAVLKIDLFPFTRYGTIAAEVTRVGHDAIPEPEAQATESNGTQSQKPGLFTPAERTQNLVFPVTLKLDKTAVTVDGESVPLKPGMSVKIEIATGSRRILEYFLSPLVEVASEAIRER
jgi:hemolysin D